MQQKTQVRIVAGTLRGRRLNVVVSETLRPTPQMVREALFSILGNAIPDTDFYDVFSGTGAVGLEAISRGARRVYFIERDFNLANAIEGHAKQFGVHAHGQVLRSDAYRWAERWLAPPEPVNLFLSPPFADLTGRPAGLRQLIEQLYTKMASGSVLVVQLEVGYHSDLLPEPEAWETRQYGRNLLLIRQKEGAGDATEA
jgi:16S rRNA (guanine(966)-N(2))-methyltransferase RsmD